MRSVSSNVSFHLFAYLYSNLHSYVHKIISLHSVLREMHDLIIFTIILFSFYPELKLGVGSGAGIPGFESQLHSFLAV